ncbi:hypothetical protein [Leptospira tipperaryensis]|nr:hypothetical protein [Leptospira tipperaryensis]
METEVALTFEKEPASLIRSILYPVLIKKSGFENTPGALRCGVNQLV